MKAANGSRHPARPTRASKRKVVLIFGEDENDTKALKNLLHGLWPNTPWVIRAMRRPPILIKDARPTDIPPRINRIIGLIRATEATSDVVAIFLHEDCDAVEPAHHALADKIKDAFSACGYQVEAAVPAWEMEAWLLQWPQAFALHVPSWRSLQAYQGRSVGLITDAKETVRRELRAKIGGREYRESDAPALAEIVAKSGWARTPHAKSDSYMAFIAAADRVTAGRRGA